MHELKKAIFFDRDGTLIVDKVYLNDPNQIEYLDGVFDALQALKAAGYIFIIVTNQSGVARGLVSLENLEEIHRRIIHRFADKNLYFEGVYYAPHAADSGHPMRKPEPGMLTTAAECHKIDLKKSWMIGDRMSDVEAGHRAGCRTILLEGEDNPDESPFSNPTQTCTSILEAAQFILKSDSDLNSPINKN